MQHRVQMFFSDNKLWRKYTTNINGAKSHSSIIIEGNQLVVGIINLIHVLKNTSINIPLI